MPYQQQNHPQFCVVVCVCIYTPLLHTAGKKSLPWGSRLMCMRTPVIILIKESLEIFGKCTLQHCHGVAHALQCPNCDEITFDISLGHPHRNCSITPGNKGSCFANIFHSWFGLGWIIAHAMFLQDVIVHPCCDFSGTYCCLHIDE